MISFRTTTTTGTMMMMMITAMGWMALVSHLLVTHTTATLNQLYRLDNAELIQQQQQQQHHHHGIPGHYEFEVAPRMEPPAVRRPPYPQSAQLCPGSVDPFAGFSPRNSLCGDLNQGRVPINPLGQAIDDQSYPFELIKNKTLQFLARALPVLKLEYDTIPKVARYLPTNHLLNPTHQTSPLSQEHMQKLNQRFAAANGFSPEDYFAGAPYATAGAGVARRRRKRSAAQPSTGSGSVSPVSLDTLPYNSSPSGLLVAEMSPNASLVVSSAHSSPGATSSAGRIHSLARSVESGELQLRSSSSSSGDLQQMAAVITKDGYKSVSGPPSSSSHQRAGQQQQQPRPQHAATPSNSMSHHYYNSNDWPASVSSNIVQQTADYSVLMPQSSSSSLLLLNSNQLETQTAPTGANGIINKPHKLPAQTQSTSQGNVSKSGNSYSYNQQQQQPATNGNNGDRQQNLGHGFQHYRQQQQQQQVVAANNSLGQPNLHATITSNSYRMAPASDPQTATGQQQSVDPSNHVQARSPADSADRLSGSQPGQSTSSSPSSSSGSTSGSSGKHGNQHQQQQQQALAKQDTSSKRRLSCGESANGFTSTICQAAAALIEGDRPPAWLQLVKHLGNAYSSSTSDSFLGPSSNSGLSIWSLLSGLAQQQDQFAASNAKSSGGAGTGSISRAQNIMSLLGPVTALLSGGGGSSSSTALPPSAAPKESSSGGDKNQESPQTKAADQSQSVPFGSSLVSALGSSTMTKLALAGWASNAIAGLVEYFVPSFFQSFSNSRSFSKRKKPFDPQEQFVDTPASMAALANLQTAGRQASAGGGQDQLASLTMTMANTKQPPTPCPSVEEYISPTFARNYQGAWKYVVQIPHEGYFTQTIQKTSCVRQKCEFTEGVCHESPRWVSLLVAEIYYPNTIFGTQPAQQQQQPGASMMSLDNQMLTNGGQNMGIHQQQPQQPLAVSSSTSSIQQVAQGLAQQQQQQYKPSTGVQDPLQMTDSLSTYNHNLNNAFINAANELGWDPNNMANMQRLANAYNYQLMQRNGLLAGQQPQEQQQQLESRQGSTFTSPPVMPQTFSSQAQQPLSQQQQQQQLLSNQQSGYNTDYITALAAATLQQNPNVNIQDLINSLQLSQRRRKKRDLTSSGPQVRSQPNRMSQYAQQATDQHRSGVESVPSMNDIAAHSSSSPSSSSGQQQQSMDSNQFKQQQQPLVSPSAQNSQLASGNEGGQIGASQTTSGASDSGNANQVECDGRDKLGCYVVRVYYDWFLVNGSCKCWKTSTSASQTGGSNSGQSSSGNSFLRRIFTG